MTANWSHDNARLFLLDESRARSLFPTENTKSRTEELGAGRADSGVGVQCAHVVSKGGLAYVTANAVAIASP